MPPVTPSSSGSINGTAPPPPISQQPPDDNTAASMDAQVNPPSQIGMPGGAQSHPAVTMPKESWGRSVYHGVLSALGGANDVSLQRDPKSGQMIATSVKSGPGQQWKNIIAGALTGYAAAAATGAHGPGSTSAKIGAGFQAAQGRVQQHYDRMRQEANEDFATQQKAATQNAQNALLTTQNTKMGFDITQQKVKASVEDSDRENTFGQVLAAGGNGSQDLGVFHSFDEVMKAFKDNPALHDHMAGGRLVSIPHIAADGTIDGIHAALVTQDWLNAKIDKDLPIQVQSYKDGKLTTDTFTIPAGSLTGDQYAKMVMSQSTDSLKQHNEDVKTEQAAAKQTAAEKKEAAQEPLWRSEEAQHYATARKTNAETDYLNRTGSLPGTEQKGKISEEDMPATVDAIGLGHMDAARMYGLVKANPGIIEEVAKKYPDFDTSKVGAYADAYKKFTSGKGEAAAINSAGTSLKHLAELQRLNTAMSHIPGTPDYKAYMEQVHIAAEELSKLYGGGVGTVSGTAGHASPLEGIGLGRDKAIKTAVKALGEKLDSYQTQWDNALPSKRWHIDMPGIDSSAIAARTLLDPEYARRVAAQQVEAQGGPAAAPQQQTTAPQPNQAQPQLPPQARAQLQEGHITTFGNGQSWTLKNGQPAQVNQAGR